MEKLNNPNTIVQNQILNTDGQGQQKSNTPKTNLNSINNSNNLSLNENMTQDEKDKLAEQEIKILLDELKSNQPMTAQNQIKRLLNANFVSPYEVLGLSSEVTEEEIKKQFRQLTMLLHPDKCSDPKAVEAFQVVETAYKNLMDVDKRKIVQRIIREAKERVEATRKEDNKKRTKKGLPILPDDTLESEIKLMMKKIIEEIEERKNYTEKQEHAHKKREREEVEETRLREELERQNNKEWETYRDKRVKNWNKFRERIMNGKKKGKYETKPPKYKAEERTENLDIYRNTGGF